MPRRDDYKWIEDDPKKGGFAVLNADKINRLGLGPEIVKLKLMGMSGTKIAQMLALNPDTTRRWIRNFNALTATQKKEYLKLMEENSVFNLKDQLEKIYSQTEKMAKLVEDNPQLYVKYMSEQRQMVNLAAEILEKVERLNTQKETVRIILEAIGRADPEIRISIMRELNSIKEIRGLIT